MNIPHRIVIVLCNLQLTILVLFRQKYLNTVICSNYYYYFLNMGKNLHTNILIKIGVRESLRLFESFTS